jgi:NADP-dependent 3-hydroxy acid dehydrogenase YdfG
MPFQYKNVLLVGATAGIGAAMADRLIQEGSTVIAVGRRQERIDEFVNRHGGTNARAIAFDISNRSEHDSFVAKSVIDLNGRQGESTNISQGHKGLSRLRLRLSQRRRPEHV